MFSLKCHCHLHFYCPDTRNCIIFSLFPCKCHCFFCWSCPCSLLVWQQSWACCPAPFQSCPAVGKATEPHTPQPGGMSVWNAATAINHQNPGCHHGPAFKPCCVFKTEGLSSSMYFPGFSLSAWRIWSKATTCCQYWLTVLILILT